MGTGFAANVLNSKMKTVHFSGISFFHSCYGLSVSLIIITIEALGTGRGYQVDTAKQYGPILLTAFVDTFALAIDNLLTLPDS